MKKLPPMLKSTMSPSLQSSLPMGSSPPKPSWTSQPPCLHLAWLTCQVNMMMNLTMNHLCPRHHLRPRCHPCPRCHPHPRCCPCPRCHPCPRCRLCPRHCPCPRCRLCSRRHPAKPPRAAQPRVLLLL